MRLNCFILDSGSWILDSKFT